MTNASSSVGCSWEMGEVGVCVAVFVVRGVFQGVRTA